MRGRTRAMSRRIGRMSPPVAAITPGEQVYDEPAPGGLDYTFTTPHTGDYRISAIGPGWNGDGAGSSSAYAGGGGGAFAGGIYTFAANVQLKINIPQGGFGGNAVVGTGSSASQGLVVKALGGSGQSGGATVGCVGQVVWPGGDGAAGEGGVGGGGGGAAGPMGGGNPAAGRTGGDGTTPGGRGGDGGLNNAPGIGSPGDNGYAPGGGGGAGGAAGGAGGAGGNGWVRISWPA